MIRPLFQQAVDGLQHARDRRAHLESLHRMCESAAEFRLHRDLVFAPVPRGKRPDAEVRKLAAKALHIADAEKITHKVAAHRVTDDGAIIDAMLRLMKRRKIADQLRGVELADN